MVKIKVSYEDPSEIRALLPAIRSAMIVRKVKSQRAGPDQKYDRLYLEALKKQVDRSK